MTNAGRLDEAAAALRVASGLFDPEKMPPEHAKSLNALGAALRLQGRLEEAARAFDDAGAGFGSTGATLEQGAATFNLGLVQRELGRVDPAAASFEAARRLLDAERVPHQAAAAARELGVTQLATGDLEGAIATLGEARDLAEQLDDQAGLGAAANALGLAFLALPDLRAAIESFQLSAAAHPRTIRPDAYAMAKANLALAYERAGNAPHARAAGRQALQVADAAEPVVDQARGVLDHLGSPPGDLLAILDEEDADRWPGIVREELGRWARADPGELFGEAQAWVDGVAQRPDRAVDLAEVWLGALLELAPPEMERVIEVTMESLAVDAGAAGAFRSPVLRAMPRFYSPQELRLRDAFGKAASTRGLAPWT